MEPLVNMLAISDIDWSAYRTHYSSMEGTNTVLFQLSDSITHVLHELNISLLRNMATPLCKSHRPGSDVASWKCRPPSTCLWKIASYVRMQMNSRPLPDSAIGAARGSAEFLNRLRGITCEAQLMRRAEFPGVDLMKYVSEKWGSP